MAFFSSDIERSDSFDIGDRAEAAVLALREELDVVKRERDKYMKECMRLKEILQIKSEAERERNEALQHMLNAQKFERRLTNLIDGIDLNYNINDDSNYGIIRSVQPQREREDADSLYSNITTTSAREATDDIKSLASTTEVNIDFNEEAGEKDCAAPDLPPRPPCLSIDSTDSETVSAASLARLSRSEASLNRYRPKRPKFVKKLLRRSKQKSTKKGVGYDTEMVHKF